MVKNNTRRAFTPLQTIGRQRRDMMSVTGFTLIEIMVVVVVLLILVGLSIPNILRSRIIAYEGVAVVNIKTLGDACQLYHMNQGSYPDTLDDLANSNPAYVDSGFGSSTNNIKQRYQFVYVLVNADSFTINANPTSTSLLKGRYFYIDESGIIHAKSDGPAGPDDETIE